jgi:hypothetical protein
MIRFRAVQPSEAEAFEFEEALDVLLFGASIHAPAT